MLMIVIPLFDAGYVVVNVVFGVVVDAIVQRLGIGRKRVFGGEADAVVVGAATRIEKAVVA